MTMSLVLNQFKGPTITPSYAGRTGRNATKIAFQGEIGLSFNEKRLFRAGGPTDETHVIILPANNQLMLGCAGSIHKGPSDRWEIGRSFLEDSDSSPSGIGYATHVI
jgi:hypothetical protein